MLTLCGSNSTLKAIDVYTTPTYSMHNIDNSWNSFVCGTSIPVPISSSFSSGKMMN